MGRRLLVGLRGLEPRIVLRMREEPGLGAKVKRCVGCWKVLWGTPEWRSCGRERSCSRAGNL